MAGFTVLKVPFDEVNSPSMNSPYDGARETTERDSGAGAYSKRDISPP